MFKKTCSKTVNEAENRKEKWDNIEISLFTATTEQGN